MSSEMIERVARAICVGQGIDPDGDSRYVEQGDGSVIVLDVALEPGMEKIWRYWVHVAHNAIEAMHDPSGEMFNAGCKVCDEQCCNWQAKSERSEADLEAAKRAVESLRRRQCEDVDEWANELGKVFGSFAD